MAMEMVIVNPVTLDTLKNKKLVAACKRIEKASDDTRKALFRIAYELRRIDANKLYADDGYKNISDCAEKLFGYKKAMTNNLVRIAENYMDAAGALTLPTGEGAKDWTVGQLQELLKLSPEVVRELVASGTIHSGMTSKAIRQAVKDYCNQQKAIEDGESAESTTPQGELPPVDDSEDDDSTMDGGDSEMAFENAHHKALSALSELIALTDGDTAAALAEMLEALHKLG